MGILGVLLGSMIFWAIGIALAFWGYKLHVRLPFLPGLWAGALIGGATGCFFGLPQGPIAGAVLLGVAFSVLSGQKKKAGDFLVTFAYVYAPTATSCSVPWLSSGLSIVPMIILLVIFATLGTILGLLAVRFPRAWISVETGLLGAFLVIAPTGTAAPAMLSVIIFLLVAGGGIYVQMNYTGVLDKAALAAGVAPVAPAPVAANGQVPAQQSVAAPAGPLATCPNCGMPLKPGTKFCPECGQSTAQAPNT